ncbi:MAG: M20/M25/M40 family metallo-hydrolase [Chloroflexi bacterium]|jgi:acetylornithine deacetylase/succinyl-diaminopimelate desuccinylase-like protein|uniref:Peptidase M20 n=1 Tax=Candidatus Thermofonsia Clade 3 bacterium TaxID=2364212 RepID=A0A2M8QCM0_9CHLR|nr:M20/M25/M40 family metallo-hydrolase [Candidatus Roseilinea sp. NK_OTU-006]PJF47556.1 MAG: peptidase M20 [Candidatus Thermofonsia Clade 3 bacterium]RMG62069.1 MAG: M20/M25/M40 family metallo-hydrolase [Chloroflexota bacterium]
MNAASFDAYLREHRERLLEDYKDFLRQPSVAATGQGIPEMAALVARRLAALGAEVKVVPTEGDAPPVVWAELGEGDKELLIYNHYDVQPAEPLELWESPPFEPTIRDGKIFARGASDDKGELVTRIHALEAWLATQGRLPFKIKWLIEGEEEVGSPHLHAWVERYRSWLHKPDGRPMDGCLWEFGGFDERGRFTLTMGVKGICYVELHVQGVSHDLHSSNAAIAPNAAWRLVWALNTIKDASERILIEGYYDHVRALTPAEEALLRQMPFDEDEIKAKWGIAEFITGVTGFDAVKRLFFQPTATICGLTSGWQGQGIKTVLPAVASAKVDFRLVPNLTPEIVLDLLRRHLDKHGFSDIEIKFLGGYRAELSDVNAPIVHAATRACERIYNQTPVKVLLSPGSGPMYSLSSFIGGVPTVCAGISHPDSRVHSPNENAILQHYYDGMRYIGALIDEFAQE